MFTFLGVTLSISEVLILLTAMVSLIGIYWKLRNDVDQNNIKSDEKLDQLNKKIDHLTDRIEAEYKDLSNKMEGNKSATETRISIFDERTRVTEVMMGRVEERLVSIQTQLSTFLHQMEKK